MTGHNSQSAPSAENLPKVAVIGGGLAGLSAAHRLAELSRERNQPVEITLLEAGPRLGGLVGTERIGDYLVDLGADSFLTNKPAAVNLCRRLGIESRLVATDARYRGAMVLREGRPVPVPDGFQLLSPTAVWPVLTTPIFSIWGKLRLLSEWFIPRRPMIDSGDSSVRTSSDGNQPLSKTSLVDESVAGFVRRRLGREALERLIQPLVGGIYTADPERLSLAATMPRFLEMERDHGSLIRAAFATKTRSAGNMFYGRTESGEMRSDLSSGARYGLFAGLKGGMEDLVGALREKIQSSCQVRLQTEVTSVMPASSGYRITLADDRQECFSAVIFASTGSRTAELLKTVDANLSREIGGIEYSSCAIVVSGHRLADVKDPLRAFGLVIPHTERRRILAVSFSSRKFPDRAPEGHVLLRTFLGGAMQPEIYSLGDQQMLNIVRSELADILGVGGEPDFMRVCRYSNSMPQYVVGHLERVARIESLAKQHPGIALTGIAFRGVGVPDVIASGERAASDVMATVASRKASEPRKN